MADNKRIVLIGAGNVATHLGVALKRAGQEVMQVYSRTEASASALAERLGVPFTTSLDEVVSEADLYI
ncbi:MAG: NAD(P)-binding domain-containing protein, partial [Bacteroidaceae bacterium]|nr:NAD(P)-binding domain-containing protein [Bacteroidaceae bacterium]